MSIFNLDKKIWIIFGISASFLFSIGVIIGYYGKEGEVKSAGMSETEKIVLKHITDRFSQEQNVIAELLENVNSEYLRNYHKQLTSEPHIAGMKRDKELINYIRDAWIQMGLDRVDLAEYDFFLSWPNQTNPNKIHLLDESNQIKFTSKHKEEELRPGDDHPNFIHAFNAYAPAGTVTGQLVYVNYGRVEDLDELESLNMTVEGKICIARYGMIFRGNKVHNCQDRGGIGMIIFSDPSQVAPHGTQPEKVYPNTIFLPGSGIQRGSTYIGDGDPLSPYWSSVPNAYRIKPEDVRGIPKIPAQPIGYDDAKKLLEKMGGPLPPDAWKGNISGVQYRLGGEMLSEYSGWTARLVVNNYRGTIKSSNIIGIITGEVEPDRYVIMGNHRDAWGYGSVDPSSGTAVIMEVIRSFSELLRLGWRPRRSIVFCSWAAEEYGLEGSFEWVYEKKDKLSQRTVGVLNVDNCVAGPIPSIGTSPVLHDVILDALKHAADPSSSSSNRSCYEFWEDWVDKDGIIKPEFNLLGSGTDHAPFAFFAGIPAASIGFRPNSKKDGVTSYPAYHTGYETFYLMDKLIDPGFRIHRTCVQTSLRVLLNLADSLILPYNLNRFPAQMKKSIAKILNKTDTQELFEMNNVTLRHLSEAIHLFEKTAQDFMMKLSRVRSISDPVEIRTINDQLMQLERVFIMGEGLPNRPGVKNAIFAPELFNKYGGSAFPALNDLLHDIKKLEAEELNERWELIKRHISDLMIMVQNAAKFLAPVDQI